MKIQGIISRLLHIPLKTNSKSKSKVQVQVDYWVSIKIEVSNPPLTHRAQKEQKKAPNRAKIKKNPKR